MKRKFYAPDLSDKRMLFSVEYLKKYGYEMVNTYENCDFVILGINPPDEYLTYIKPIFAGNVGANNVFDYTKEPCFAIKNAYLTAEGAISMAISFSDISLIDSNILIVGYGKIAKALEKNLQSFTNNITICARKSTDRVLANCNNSKAIDFNDLVNNANFDFIFNTVPHPVFNQKELTNISQDTLIIDLASFPGGVDKHIAQAKKLNLVVARGLPGKYSPKSAGKIVADTINSMIEEVII